ncbi:clock-controlled protein 6 [Chaetomidium leptoderma]|uniref:Clock-controlled protein 6 n=1 Tax=Chaetomidium leptoderma TaxID=669021 RepID=A0AAN6ZV47_9PEZI|nr:clock-controlled protein 6 [Chaetomidium leptoderma]
MKFAAAVLALAVGALAVSNETVTYTTEVVTAITTFCPEATEVTYGGSTYTVTEATTLTISDCPCTIKVPVTTVSSVICNNCPPPAYHNSTASAAPTPPAPTTTPVGTISIPVVPSSATTGVPIETAGAGRAAVLSGGALAGVLGLAAFIL